MPPPKKPKNGVTRIEEFLSATELQELCHKSRNISPDLMRKDRDSVVSSSGSDFTTESSTHDEYFSNADESEENENKETVKSSSDILQTLLSASTKEEEKRALDTLRHENQEAMNLSIAKGCLKSHDDNNVKHNTLVKTDIKQDEFVAEEEVDVETPTDEIENTKNEGENTCKSTGFKPTETRRFDSLMKRRKFESLMDVLHPVLPESHPSNQRAHPVPTGTSYRQERLSSDYALSILQQHRDRASQNDRLFSDRGTFSEKDKKQERKHFKETATKVERSFENRDSFINELYRNNLYKFGLTADHELFRRSNLQNPVPLSSVSAFASQNAADLFRSSHLHEISKQIMQDPLAHYQMSGRPALYSFFSAAKSYSPQVADSSGQNSNDSSATKSNSRVRSPTHSIGAHPIAKSNAKEPIDMEYDSAAADAVKSVRYAENSSSSSQKEMNFNMEHSHHPMTDFNPGFASTSLNVGDQCLLDIHHNIVKSTKTSIGNDLSSSTLDMLQKGIDDKGVVRRCQVCNDNASGFHYGVWSCEGCKAFFKRSLQGPVDYVCPATNSCTIDKHRRKSCQACRLRKCMDMGMSRGNCRKERRPSGSRSLKHKSSDFMLDTGVSPNKKDTKTSHTLNESSHNYTSLKQSNSCPSVAQSFHASPSASFGGSIAEHSNHGNQKGANAATGSQLAVISPFRTSTTTLNEFQQSRFSSRSPHASYSSGCSQHRTTHQSQSSVHPLVEHLLKIDLPARQSGHDSTKEQNEATIVSSILRLCDMELVDIINWAKSIPGYTELELADRIHLLECCWMEIVLFGLMWRSLNKPDIIHLSTDLQLDREKLRIAKFTQIGSLLLACIKQLRNLDLKQEEFVLLRCLILLNSDLGSLQNVEKIENLKTRIMEALQYTVVERYGGNLNRMMKILLILPHTRQVGMQLIRHLMSDSIKPMLPMYALLKEMVEAFCTVMGFSPVTSSDIESDSKAESNLTV